jgi:bifunctional non-homologous end joining protein LigD
MVFDLDPGQGSSIVECCRVARWVAEQLAEGAAGCRVKTSGSKGLQVYLPLSGRPTWDKVRDRARGVAVQLERDHADLVVSNMRKALRPGKVLIDWSQNHPAKTTVAAYSLRGRSEPTVSTPVTWDEVDHCARSGEAADLRFTSDQVLTRVEARGDLFAAV